MRRNAGVSLSAGAVIAASIAVQVGVDAGGLAQPDLPDLFADGMVIQSDRSVPVWGWSLPNSTVRVSGSWGATDSVTVDDSGAWMAHIDSPSAGGPHSITVRDETGERTLSDVLSGEVWIASGQSNMHMRVRYVSPQYKGTVGWRDAVVTSEDPMLRVLDVPERISPTPTRDTNGVWKAASPDTTGDFSAAAYYFARELREQLGVPVGIITSDWGGTRAEAWTPLDDLAGFSRFANEVEMVRAMQDQRTQADAAEADPEDVRWAEINEADPGLAKGWLKPDPSDQGWESVPQPGVWEATGMPDFDGLVWLRRSVSIPKSWVGTPLRLSLGPIDDQDITYANGIEIGSTRGEGQWATPRVYQIPAHANSTTRLDLAIRVLDTGRSGGLHGTPDQLTVSRADGVGEPIAIAGLWDRRPGLAAGQIPSAFSFTRHSPSALYNGMITPIAPFAARGFIWYQGESNRYAPEEYADLFPAMIRAWRRETHNPDASFLFVQIAPLKYGPERNENTAKLRQSQLESLRVPNTGMVVTADIGEARDIHPRQKRKVGERLAMAALTETYGLLDDSALSPVPRSVARHPDGVRVSFNHTGGALVSTGEAVGGFEIRGADGVWRPAHAFIREADIELVGAAAVNASAVRYLWSRFHHAQLLNIRSLPVSPFLMEITGDSPQVNEAASQ